MNKVVRLQKQLQLKNMKLPGYRRKFAKQTCKFYIFYKTSERQMIIPIPHSSKCDR